MRVIVITPPAPIVTWDEAEVHLKLDGDDTDQGLIEAYIAAATETIEGPDGWLGRALGVQELEARFDRFDCRLRLPCPPLIDIVSVTYLDGDNVEQTLDPAAYELIDRTLIAAMDVLWPSTACRAEAVRVRYRAGYAVDANADPIVSSAPARAKAAILLMVGDLYANRGTTVPGQSTEVPMSTTVQNLFSTLRVWE